MYPRSSVDVTPVYVSVSFVVPPQRFAVMVLENGSNLKSGRTPPTDVHAVLIRELAEIG
jgi:hypothetical protein